MSPQSVTDISQSAEELPREYPVRDPGDRRESEVELRPQSSISLIVIAVVGVLFALYFARAIAMPIVMSLVLALLLRPVVRSLRRYRIPDYLSAAVLLGSIVLVIVVAGMSVMDPARRWITNAPENLKSAGDKLKILMAPIEQIGETSEQVEELANGEKAEEPGPPFPFAPDSPGRVAAAHETENSPEGFGTVGNHGPNSAGNSARDPATTVRRIEPEEKLQATENRTEEVEEDDDEPVPVEVKQPRLQTGLTIFSTTGNLLAQFFTVLVLAFFLLSWGDVLLNNVLHTLSTWGEKRHTVELVHSVENGISTYLLTVTCINFGLGVAIGTAMWSFGMPTPVLWGVMAMLFNFVPYLGALVGIGVVFIVALLSFDSLSYTLLVPLTYFLLTSLEGNLITPNLLGKSMSLNPILIIVSLIFWSWLWGVGGAILAVPLLAILKVGFDQFERTKAFGVMLSGSG